MIKVVWRWSLSLSQNVLLCYIGTDPNHDDNDDDDGDDDDDDDDDGDDAL